MDRETTNNPKEAISGAGRSDHEPPAGYGGQEERPADAGRKSGETEREEQSVGDDEE